MDELINLSIQLHILFVLLLVGLILGNLYLLKSNKTFFNLSKRLELLAPQYYIALSAIFFTGLIVMAVQQFSFSARILEMYCKKSSEFNNKSSDSVFKVRRMCKPLL